MHFVDDSMDELINKRSKIGAPVKYRGLADSLSANPGVWANVTEEFRQSKTPYMVSNRISKGKLAAFSPEGAFEAKVVNGEIYARAVAW